MTVQSASHTEILTLPVDVQLEIARRLAYINDVDHQKVAARVDRVGRMLNGLIESLQPLDDDWP